MRVAVDKFAKLYNQEWRIERLSRGTRDQPKPGTGKLLDRIGKNVLNFWQRGKVDKMRLNNVQEIGCDTP